MTATWERAARAAAVAALAAVPLLQSNGYWLHVFSIAVIDAVLALGLQLLVGRAGLLSLGQGAFFGIGAYVAGWVSLNWGQPFLAALLLGGAGAALCSLLLIPIVRLRGASLGVATLGFGIIVHLVLLNEEWLTGGSMGMMGIPAPTLLGFDLGGDRTFYWVCLAVMLLTYLALARLGGSRFGRALAAICQDEEAAQASGIVVARYKRKCFLVAAFIAGLGGGLYAYQSRYLSPNDFTFAKSIEILTMVVIGGLGSLPGAVLGAFIVAVAPEVLRSSGELRMILFGLVVVVLMGAGNRGLIGLGQAAVTAALSALRRLPTRTVAP